MVRFCQYPGCSKYRKKGHRYCPSCQKYLNRKSEEDDDTDAVIADSQRDMLGDDADYFETIGYNDFGCK